MATTTTFVVDIVPTTPDAKTKRAMAKPNDVPHWTMDPTHTNHPACGMGPWFDSMPSGITAFQNELYRRNVVDGLNMTDKQMVAIWRARYAHRRMSNGQPYPVSYIRGARNSYNTGRHGQNNIVPPAHELSPEFVSPECGYGPGVRVPTTHCPDEFVPAPSVKQSKRQRKITA